MSLKAEHDHSRTASTPVLISPAQSGSRVKSLLRDAGLRPTRQRIILGGLLFGQHDRHVSAEQLYDEANLRDKTMSLATVYNTLRQFTEAGLLREVLAAGSRSCFDTKTDDHHHFIVEEDGTIFDAPGVAIDPGQLPQAPEGYAIIGVDVLIRLKRIDAAKAGA